MAPGDSLNRTSVGLKRSGSTPRTRILISLNRTSVGLKLDRRSQESGYA